MLRRLSPLLAVLALAAVPATATAGETEPSRYYVSLGDSYAVGYQATGQGQGRATRKGFADQLPAAARARGHRLTLVNFGCGGETAKSLLTRRTACPVGAVGGPRYAGRTQIAAAERFLRANRGKVALITVSIGGNDVTRCVREADTVGCVAAAVKDLEANVATIAKRLRAAAGKKTRIVGTTYPDVILGQWTTGRPADQELARLSVVAFKSLINPALKAAYAKAGGRLVDVTAATGAYGSLEETTTLAPYGTLPVPVAKVCRLTYYCQYRDIHARTSGYAVIAKLVAATLPRR